MSYDYISNKMEWISSLKVGAQTKNMRKTSIICTIGMFKSHSTFIYALIVPNFYFIQGPKTNS
ncbi:5779_t:CDS:1, partial [Scutellospora calospora]